MVPLAIGNAAGVKVGFSNGAKDYHSLKKYAITAMSMSTVFMASSSFLVASAPGIIVSLFTKDIQLIEVSIPIVYTLCFFQVFDGLQATLAGIFRGLKHTEVVMAANFIAFWLVAIPLGCLLALHFKLELIGFWYALIVSIIILCTIMFVNLLQRFKKMEV